MYYLVPAMNFTRDVPVRIRFDVLFLSWITPNSIEKFRVPCLLRALALTLNLTNSNAFLVEPSRIYALCNPRKDANDGHRPPTAVFLFWPLSVSAQKEENREKTRPDTRHKTRLARDIPRFSSMLTDIRTHGRTDIRTHGRTHPRIKMRRRI